MMDNLLCRRFTSFLETTTFLLDPPVYHIEHFIRELSWKTPETKYNMLLKPLKGKLTGSNKDVKWRVKNGFLEH